MIQLKFLKPLLKAKSSFLIMGVIALGMAYISWRKWPDILVDFGRELYIPWQLSNGSRLYLDIAYFNGPLSPYLNSILFKIFRPSFEILAIFNLGIVIAVTLLVFQIFLRISNLLVATVLGCIFLIIFAFSQYLGGGSFNYITPYAHDLTHGIFLSLWTISLFTYYVEKRNKVWLAAIGFSLGLCFLTKVEVFSAISLGIGVGLFWTLREHPSCSEICVSILILCLTFLLPLIGFLGFFSQYESIKESLHWVIYPYRIVLERSLFSLYFYKNISGMDIPLTNLVDMLVSFLWELTGLFLFVLLPAYLIRSLTDRRLQISLMVGILLIMIASSPYLIKFVPWSELLRPLPLITLVIIFQSIRDIWIRTKRGESVEIQVIIQVLAWFSLILISKIILNVHVYHYGFALAMPATLLAIYFLVDTIPVLIGKRFGNVNFIRVLGIILIGIFSFVHFEVNYGVYSKKDFLIGANGNQMMTWNPEISKDGVVFEKTMEMIEKIIRPHENFIVLPEGVMLNFLTQRKNPSPYTNFMPPEMVIFGEDQILNTIKKNPPDYFILVNRRMSEYGNCFFGKDYGVSIFRWVQKNYEPICKIENGVDGDKRGLGVVIVKRMKEREGIL